MFCFVLRENGTRRKRRGRRRGGDCFKRSLLIILPLLSYKFSNVVNTEEQDYEAVINQP